MNNLVLIGLGNPGLLHSKDRHNAAWIIFDTISDHWTDHSYAFAQKDIIAGHDAYKPQLFMNRSGETVRYLSQKEDVTIDQLVILHDDIDLPLGTLRLSYNRGNGGHNGIKSIEKVTKKAPLLRLRIGVSPRQPDGQAGRPSGAEQKSFVLQKFSKAEIKLLQTTVKDKFLKTLQILAEEGKEKAATFCNQKTA